MDQDAWGRVLRRFGAAAIGGGALFVLALPWLLPPSLRWATAHLSSDHRISARGAAYAAVLMAAAGLAAMALGLLARRLTRGALLADLRRLFADPPATAEGRYSTLIAGWVSAIALVALAAAAPAGWRIFGEAGVVEILQLLALLGTAAASTSAAVRLRSRSVARTIHALVAVAAIAVVGEELSWGQTLFHWSTPDSWAAINVQSETNFHNLFNSLFMAAYVAAVAGVLLALAVSTALVVTHRDSGPLAFLLLRPSLSGPAAAMAASLVVARLIAGDGYWLELIELFAYLLLLGWAREGLLRARLRSAGRAVGRAEVPAESSLA